MIINYKVSKNQLDSQQSSPSWCVAFVRFRQPASGYDKPSSLLETKPLMIVENDCVSISYSGSKNSFAKTCSISLKAGDVNYLSAVNPGDWVCVWIHSDIKKIKDVINELMDVRSGNIKINENDTGSNTLNNWDSGLKFIGRVLSVNHSDQISQDGRRVVYQNIHCQAFLELASSVYFTETAMKMIFNAGDIASAVSEAERQGLKEDKALEYIIKGKKRFGDTNVQQQLLQKMNSVSSNPQERMTPDLMIQFLMIFLMGMSRNEFGTNLLEGAAGRGTFGSAIMVPKDIAIISGRPSATKVYHFYNVYLGVQKYNAAEDTEFEPYKSFNPVFSSTSHKNIFHLTPRRCDGWIYFKMPQWTNISYWTAFGQFLNPVVNEMYTTFKCDAYNRIRPTFTVREIPFSTGLYNNMSNEKLGTFAFHDPKKDNKKDNKKDKKNVNTNKNDSKSKSNVKVKPEPLSTEKSFIFKRKTDRSFYYNLPRWEIDESMIISLNVSTLESRRINFVQVWTTSQVPNGLSTAPKSNSQGSIRNQYDATIDVKEKLMLMGNYIADDNDIARNGLRADITESPFDFYAIAGSAAPIWARMRADWLFNGHLKLYGTVETVGISEPICEGDNAVIRGVLYHIESVEHRCMLSHNGNKIFRTILTLSNGVLASSLVNEDSVPMYVCHSSTLPEDNVMPGLTAVEISTSSPRTQNGDRIKKQDQESNK